MTIVRTTRLSVRVHTRAAAERRAWDGKVLELWVSRPPVHGAANASIIDMVAHWLDIPRGCVRIVSGHTSRSKLLEVESVGALPPSETLL
jgi:uncharacterized protein YggU (UPF0235/DUF167 family)